MGLPSQVYRFNGAIPSHDEVWRALCNVLGRELAKSECRPVTPQKSRADWRVEEKRGGYMLERWNTTFYDSAYRHLSININNFVRGDAIATSGGDKALQEAMMTAMKQLGGEPIDLDDLRRSKN